MTPKQYLNLLIAKGMTREEAVVYVEMLFGKGALTCE
jgi:hypothetical protein